MATTLTIRTDIDQAQRGLQQLSRELDKTTDAASDMGQDVDRAVDTLTDSLQTAEKQASETAEAVDGIADAQTLQRVDTLRQQMEYVGHSADRLEKPLKDAGKNLGQFSKVTEETGEVTQKVTKSVYDFANGLGSGGLVGGVKAAIPELTSMASMLSGPWGMAVVTGIGLLSTLALQLLDTAAAEKEAEKAVDEHRDAMESYLDTLQKRLEQERELQRNNSGFAEKQAADLQDQISIQEKLFEQIVREREERERRIETIKQEINEARKDLPTPGKGLVTIHDKTTRQLIANLRKELADLEQQNEASHQQQIDRFNELAKLRGQLSATKEVAEQKKAGEELLKIQAQGLEQIQQMATEGAKLFDGAKKSATDFFKMFERGQRAAIEEFKQKIGPSFIQQLRENLPQDDLIEELSKDRLKGVDLDSREGRKQKLQAELDTAQDLARGVYSAEQIAEAERRIIESAAKTNEQVGLMSANMVKALSELFQQNQRQQAELSNFNEQLDALLKQFNLFRSQTMSNPRRRSQAGGSR